MRDKARFLKAEAKRMVYANTGGVSPEHQNVDWKEK
jgi:hypothetical protein